MSAYLASPDDLAIVLGKPADDPKLLLALRRAGDRFVGAIGYPVILVADDVVQLSGDGSASLLLPSRPIVGDPVVEIDGTVVTDYSVGRKAGVLRRQGCGVWPDDLDNIQVTYTHGWETVPGDIADAVLEQAEQQYRTLMGVSNVSAGSESVGFFASMQTGVTQRWAETVEAYAMRGDRA